MNFRSSALEIDGTLIFSDVHLGYEKSLRAVQVPLFQFEDVIAELEKVLRNDHFRHIIINGDLKEEFSRISEQEWRHAAQFLEICREHCDELIVVKGNHDSLLSPIVRKYGVRLVDTYQFDDIFICHGDELVDLPSDCSTIVIGHEHPAITLRDAVRAEKYKCFLVGKYKGKKLIVLPAFYSAHQGSDVASNRRISPFLSPDLSEYDVFVVGDEVYPFGKVGELQ